MAGGAALCPADVIVPVILLPGIMGSRLKAGNRMVWDPDDKFMMVRNYAMNAGSVPGPDVWRIRETRKVARRRPSARPCWSAAASTRIT